MKEEQSAVPTPAQAQDPVIAPSESTELSDLSIDQLESKLQDRSDFLLANPDPQGREDPQYRQIFDALALKRKAAGLSF